MIISDLNTLEAIDGSDVVGGFFSVGSGVGNISNTVRTTIGTVVSGHLAQSQGTASATGIGTATEVDNATATTPYSSNSAGSSTSASSGSYYYW